MKMPSKSTRDDNGIALEGQLLIAMPSMTDQRFARSVIYICAHSEEGAMGLIINQLAEHIEFTELLDQLEIGDGTGETSFSAEQLDLPIHVGGPVERGRGFVLHSPDYFVEASTLCMNGDICLTATTDILHAIAAGTGPDKALMALGYAGWAPGQLENEIQANGWLHCAADSKLVFDSNLDSKYQQALFKLGVDPSHLVSTAGHA